ncbi:MAG: hypothetical protein ABW034_16870, partial [Steroidobacteraceae bacterium]
MKRSDLLVHVSAGLLGTAGMAGFQLLPAIAYAEDIELQEIVVTARRREENLQDVPVAVTALTSEALKEKNVR